MAVSAYEYRYLWYDYEYTFQGDRALIESLITDEVHSILEIPSGTGRNHWLAGIGRDVVFVDIEPRSISLLTTKIHQGANAVACVGDMRTLSLSRHFDLILVPHDSFLQILKQQEALGVLHSLKRHLYPGGRILLDVALLKDCSNKQGPLPLCYRPDIQDGVWVRDMEFSHPEYGNVQRYHRQFHDRLSVRVEFLYTRREDNTAFSEAASINLRLYRNSDLMRLISHSGLRLLECYGDYDLRTFNLSMRRMIMVLGHEDRII